MALAVEEQEKSSPNGAEAMSKKAREFDLVFDRYGMLSSVHHFPPAGPNSIANKTFRVREVLASDTSPKHVLESDELRHDELDRLRKDKDRLEWMLKNAGWYRHSEHGEENTYIQIKMLKGADLSCRAMLISSIDAAMNEGKE